jgi:acetyl-CoA carboxylase biotin carboxyl carrier protein
VSLSYEDVQEILRLLDNSPYDELNLQTDSFNLYLKRSEDNTGWSQEIQTLKTLRENTGQPGTMKPADKMPATTQTSDPPATEPDLLDIRAPMVGTFYRAPKPGAEPFVNIGSEVEEHTVIAIIEVMKLMSSIPAAMSGEIREIVAQDAQFVENGQLLMRIKSGSP